jgi:hypothetical protein
VVSFTTRPLYPRGNSGVCCVGGWLGSRTSLNPMEKNKSSYFFQKFNFDSSYRFDWWRRWPSRPPTAVFRIYGLCNATQFLSFAKVITQLSLATFVWTEECEVGRGLYEGAVQGGNFRHVEGVDPRDSVVSNNERKLMLIFKVFFSNATTCPLWTSWPPLPVVAEV